ncbi:hypothetical protein [Sediminibacterium soli]|uniref:hypothetical protein n=1 Tax=Sediminibacterium soli TaxID=2698829 RepID=UPI0013796491|nr:hypothetical protein [Sediminibacterium soli]NCI46147.1 hypothetical protein [Sediminibacterium soli]
MFKLFTQSPTGEDHIVEICDYLEVKTLISKDYEASLNDILKEFLGPADEESDDGIDDYADKMREKIEMVSGECDRRKLACGGQYPFELQFEGELLKFNGFADPSAYTYVYLLMSTRLNMNDNRIFKEVNGAGLLEFISAEVTRNYLGPLSEAIVFGTAVPGSFESKVNNLCELTGEGIEFVNHSGGPVDENDGGLDVLAWINFSDKKAAKLVAFGQCKTGTTWEDKLSDLDPTAFCKSWLYRQPAFTPIKMFFISDILVDERWYKKVVLSGILFDRLRIVDKAPKLFSEELMSNIITWTLEAVKVTTDKLN